MKKFQVNLIVLSGILLVLFLIFVDYSRNRPGQFEKGQGLEIEVLKILAPYDTTTNSKMLMNIANQYSQIDSNPKVEIEFISKNDFKKEICINLDQNKLADLIICDNSIMPALINLNVLKDVTDYINKTSKVSLYNLRQWNNTRSDGKYYGIPFTTDPYVLIWNENLFDKNGVVTPETWEDLKVAARKVQKIGIYGIGIGARQPEEITALFMQMLYSTGGSIREINSDGGIKVFELLHYLKKNRLLPIQCINWNQMDLTNKFIDGEIAMMVNNLSALSVIKNSSIDFKVGVSAVPFEKKENYMIHGKNIGISVTADYDAAIKFLDYITQKSTVSQIAAATETIPVQVEVEYNFKDDGYSISREFIQKQKEHGIAKNSLNSWFDISSAISEGIYQLISETDPVITEIADIMQDKVRIAIIEN